MKQLLSITVDETLRETVAHGTAAFPLQVYLDDLDSYAGGEVSWHWHAELEFGVMLKGSMEVSAGELRFPVRAGEGFFINANVLHHQRPLQSGSVFYSILLAPRLLYGSMGSAVEGKYVTPLLKCHALPGLALDGREGWHAGAIGALRRVQALCEAAQPGYELLATAALQALWHALYTGCRPLLASPAPEDAAARDEWRIRRMMEFIHLHYAEGPSLGQIAAAANLSTSECCRCFGRRLGCTPFAYLNDTRLRVAAGLLARGEKPTAVFEAAGYNSQSYFGAQFKRKYGCTPGAFAKQKATGQ